MASTPCDRYHDSFRSFIGVMLVAPVTLSAEPDNNVMATPPDYSPDNGTFLSAFAVDRLMNFLFIRFPFLPNGGL